MNTSGLSSKLAINKYNLDEDHPHIIVNEEICRAVCEDLACLNVCPAGVYSEQNGKIIIDWAGCLECATCQVACPSEALHWVYPRGGFGVIYRYG